jgi:hypothetical protein
MRAVARQALDGRDGLRADRRYRQDARTGGLAVDEHGAGPALGDTAAELGALQVERISKHPEQGHTLRNVDLATLAVYEQ